MNYKYRRRSLSRESFRRYSSEDRSLSRSRSVRRYRRSSSRSKRSYSKSRRYFPKDDRSYSRSSSVEPHYRDRRRHRSPSIEKESLERRSFFEDDNNHFKNPPKRRVRNMAWKLPTLNDSGTKSSNFSTPRNADMKKYNYVNRFDLTSTKSVEFPYKYESEEFKSQKEKVFMAVREKLTINKENQKLLAEYTSELNTLVGNLSNLDKDSKEYEESNKKIQSLKKAMKDLIYDKSQEFKPVSKPGLKPNKLDNRETKIYFSNLPECARGKGNLAKWISDNAKFLQPKHIAMLASQGSSYEDAVIQYKNHYIAQKVLDSCKLHGISVSWMNSNELESSRTDHSETNNGVAEVDVDIGFVDE